MLTDVHTHLNRFERAEIPALLQRARAAGVCCIVTVGMTVGTSEAGVALAAEHEMILAAVGFHPWLAEEIGAGDFPRLRKLAKQPRVVAIGEIGLDTLKEPALPWDKQVTNFRHQIRLARDIGRSLNLHVKGVEAEQALIRILREEGAREVGGLIHGFTGSLETAQAALDLGFLLSAPRQITHPDQAGIRQVFARLPLTSILLDTDCSPTATLPDGQRVEPTFVRVIAAQIAEIHGTTVEVVAEQTERNRRTLFDLQ